MTRIPGSICSIQSPETVGSFDSCLLAVSGSNEVPPLLDAIGGNELNAHNEVLAHEVGEVLEEWFSPMLPIELLGILEGHLGHLDVSNQESIFLDSRYNLAYVIIGIRFYHCKCFSPLDLKLSPREHIRIINHLQLPRVYGNDTSNK
jgi:hypothetical protein